MAILIQDSFTAADYATLNGHVADVGGAWLCAGGGTIYANKLRNDQGSYNATTSSSTNCYAKAKLSSTILGAARFALGINGTGFTESSYDLLIVDPYNNQVSLNDTLLGGYWTTDAVYKIERIGSTVNAYRDDILIGSEAARGAGSNFYLWGQGNWNNIDDYEAGTVILPPPSAPTVLTATCSTGIGESTLPDAPVASFSVDVFAGLAPLTVQFTDHSTNTPTSWLWEDETGTLSTDQNPSLVFALGTHTVRLTATNAYGSSSYQVTIMATETPVVTPPDNGVVIPSGSIPGQTIQGLIGQIGYYAVDTNANTVKAHGLTGTLLKSAGGIGDTPGKFFMPTSVSVINGRQSLDQVEIPQE